MKTKNQKPTGDSWMTFWESFYDVWHDMPALASRARGVNLKAGHKSKTGNKQIIVDWILKNPHEYILPIV